ATVTVPHLRGGDLQLELLRDPGAKVPEQSLCGDQVRFAQQLKIGEDDPCGWVGDARLLKFAGEQRGLSYLASSLRQDDAVSSLDSLPEFNVCRPQNVEPGAERNRSAHWLQQLRAGALWAGQRS